MQDQGSSMMFLMSVLAIFGCKPGEALSVLWPTLPVFCRRAPFPAGDWVGYEVILVWYWLKACFLNSDFCIFIFVCVVFPLGVTSVGIMTSLVLTAVSPSSPTNSFVFLPSWGSSQCWIDILLVILLPLNTLDLYASTMIWSMEFISLGRSIELCCVNGYVL